MLVQAGLFHARPTGYQDMRYAPPKADWLTGEFYAFFRATMAALNTLTYVPESGDCDDFAEQFVSWAKTCHRRTNLHPNAGLPVGSLFYRRDDGQAHAVVIAITSDLGLIVIEPQTGKRLSLTDREKLSCWFIRL
jgi:hypothetical protein